MTEIWEIIESNPTYEVSSMGRVRNSQNGFILTPSIHGANNGLSTPYLRIELKSPRKKFLIHRLVACAFIPNSFNYTQINHKNNNGLINDVDNLEWCDGVYNIHYSQFKPVLQYNKKFELVKEYESLTHAGSVTGCDIRLISAVCLGKRDSHHGFIWAYKNDTDLIKKRRGNVRHIV